MAGLAVLPSDRFRRGVFGWLDQKGDHYLSGEEKTDIERQRADNIQRQVELLLAKLRSLLLA
jgi:hypothetical protein